MTHQKLIVFINGKEVETTEEKTVLESCSDVGIKIPQLCYHPGLSSRGRVHVCFVKIEGSQGLRHACSTPVCSGMRILTDDEDIREARGDTVSLIAANHGAECHICIRSGNCALQDIVFEHSHLNFIPSLPRKTSTESLNAMLDLHRSRCIECGQCLHFLDEVTGTQELGFLPGPKGEGVYALFEKGILSEFSGNLLEVCPSGAIVERPVVPIVRAWQTKMFPSIDVMDAMGSAIQLECFEGRVCSVRPGCAGSTRPSWITDKIRFAYDGLENQRLTQPYGRNKQGELEPLSWIEAFKKLVREMSVCAPSEMAFLVGDMVEVDSVFLLRQLLDDMGVMHRDCRTEGAFLSTVSRGDYLFNTPFARMGEADACLVIGADIRKDAPLLYLWLREHFQKTPASIGVLGQAQDLTFSYTYLGDSPSVLLEILRGSHPFARILEAAQKPMMLVGMEGLMGPEGASFYQVCRLVAERYPFIQEEWNGFNVVHRAAARVGALDVGFVPGEGGKDYNGIVRMARAGKLKLLYLLGTDEVPLEGLHDCVFVVYQGHHVDRGAAAADLVLPGAAFSEKNGFYVSMDGRAHHVRQALQPPGEAREDWKIIRGLSEVVGYKLPYETYDDVFKGLMNYSPVFSAAERLKKETLSAISPEVPYMQSHVFSFKESCPYLTNPICRASVAMKRFAKERGR